MGSRLAVLAFGHTCSHIAAKPSPPKAQITPHRPFILPSPCCRHTTKVPTVPVHRLRFFSRHRLLSLLFLTWAWPALATGTTDQAANTVALMQALLAQEVGSTQGQRVEIDVGELDQRLQLAPCQKVAPYPLAGTRLWGRTRIGLRCVEGAVSWNAYLPITVKVFAPALVAAGELRAGRTIGLSDLQVAEIDLAADHSPAITDPTDAVGRTLVRHLKPGDALRQSHMRARQWFAAGEQVKLVVQGQGFAVTSQGRALTAGTEGRAVRVRTDNGRVVTGMPVGPNLVRVGL